MRHLLPCKPPPRESHKTEHVGDAVFAGVMGGARRLLAGGDDSEGYCMEKVA
jgi:mlo protein